MSLAYVTNEGLDDPSVKEDTNTAIANPKVTKLSSACQDILRDAMNCDVEYTTQDMVNIIAKEFSIDLLDGEQKNHNSRAQSSRKKSA